MLKMAEEDKEIKVIMLHGGQYFSSGNDLSMFVKTTDIEEAKK